MKTTLIISDVVLGRLKQEAAKQRRTLSELVECALRLFLEKKPRNSKLRPLPSHKAGKPFVDLADRHALYRAMEEK